MESTDKRQVEQGFPSFFDNFLAYLMIFQRFALPSIAVCCAPLLKTTKYAKYLCKNMNKSLVHLA